jgi:hypothetical protein
MPCEICNGFGYVNVPGSWFRGGPVQMPCECQKVDLLKGAVLVDPEIAILPDDAEGPLEIKTTYERVRE